MKALALLLAAAVAHGNPELVAKDHTQFIETNHVYDRQANLSFSQHIYWDWCWKNANHRETTRTQFDPEVKDRKCLKPENRTKLAR